MCHLLLLKVFLFQTTKKSIKNAAVAVAVAAAAEFWVPIKTGCFLVFGYGIHGFKSYLHCGKHGLVCDPCDFWNDFLQWKHCLQTANGVCMSASVCLSGWLFDSLFASACLVVLLLGWFACLLPGWLAG